jgi:hypothetical protein
MSRYGSVMCSHRLGVGALVLQRRAGQPDSGRCRDPAAGGSRAPAGPSRPARGCMPGCSRGNIAPASASLPGRSRAGNSRRGRRCADRALDRRWAQVSCPVTAETPYRVTEGTILHRSWAAPDAMLRSLSEKQGVWSAARHLHRPTLGRARRCALWGRVQSAAHRERPCARGHEVVLGIAGPWLDLPGVRGVATACIVLAIRASPPISLNPLGRGGCLLCRSRKGPRAIRPGPFSWVQ